MPKMPNMLEHEANGARPMKLVLDVRKSVEANAAVHFEKAKKARRKLEGAKAALERLQQRLQILIAEKTESEKKFAAAVGERETVAELKAKKEWYEKFRWFISSEGFLCIGGRDATTNEIIIKKHTEADDFVFHADIAGSPFFVVKSKIILGSSNKGADAPLSTLDSSSEEKGKGAANAIGKATIEEAAIATAGYSRAWKIGLQSVDVYYVKPEQVSKEARPGEYLTKGAFMIYGKKNYVPAAIELAIGVTAEGRIMGGPAAAVAKNCVKSVKITQGSTKPSDAAKKIVKILGVDSSYLDEVIRAMPAGECKVTG